MKYIVNLSSIHTLYPINKSVNAFTELCNRYSPSWRITRYAQTIDRCLCNLGIFGASAKWLEPTLNWSWVVGNNLSDRYFGKALIDSYKLGTINTELFLNDLLNTFSFMKDEKIIFTQADIEHVWHEREYLVSLDLAISKEALTHKQIALALLESAWNAMVDYTKQDEVKLKKLLEICKSDKDEIYIISNTNELQVSKLLHLLQQHHPDIAWERKIDISSIKDNKPVKVAPNIYLYLSYRVGAYKTAVDNKEAKITTTPALLKSLVGGLKCNNSEIHVISQFPKDLVEARNIGVPVENTFNAKDFYPSTARAHFKVD